MTDNHDALPALLTWAEGQVNALREGHKNQRTGEIEEPEVASEIAYVESFIKQVRESAESAERLLQAEADMHRKYYERAGALENELSETKKAVTDAEDRERVVREALRKLSFAAQTSGGTAGRDKALVAAIREAEAALAHSESGCRFESFEEGMEEALQMTRDAVQAQIEDDASAPDAISEAAFLVERLRDFEGELGDDGRGRQWHGHVAPSIARLEAALAAHDSGRQSAAYHGDSTYYPDPSEALHRLHEGALESAAQNGHDAIADVTRAYASAHRAMTQPVPTAPSALESERKAIESAIRFVNERIATRRCDSDGVSDCWRCKTVYMAKVLERALADSAPHAPEGGVPWIIVNRPGLVPFRKRPVSASARDIHDMLTALHEQYPDATCTLIRMQPHGPEPQSGKEWLDMYEIGFKGEK